MVQPATASPTKEDQTEDDDDTSYADTFFGFDDLSQNEAVVNLLVLLLQNINEKIDLENEKTSSILEALATRRTPGIVFRLR